MSGLHHGIHNKQTSPRGTPSQRGSVGTGQRFHWAILHFNQKVTIYILSSSLYSFSSPVIPDSWYLLFSLKCNQQNKNAYDCVSYFQNFDSCNLTSNVIKVYLLVRSNKGPELHLTDARPRHKTAFISRVGMLN